MKGRAEAALLSLSKTSPYSSLRPFSLRPAGVDAALHSEILPFIPEQQSILTSAALRLMMPAFRTVLTDSHSPTRELAKVLIDLAMSDGKELGGEGVDEGGRMVSNKAMRRLAGT